ncbi:hypothetical protein NHX12_009682 [Muraenolepis orangiensis]|uniref:polynucleotide adenylyltransferase n=1 Tax=Muraenolepis orangiensis TaxID=630683 RepID=A0A9Q0DJT8_9TELE|nr:hypothetical protein NHX12_009682 [Muraenolepis orangiensis]
MDLQADKRFHNLTVEQVQALDEVLTEVIPIYGRGNFPTLEVRAKDMIRVVRERLGDRGIRVRDVRLNGSTASHVMLRDNGLGHRDLDIVFGVDVPRQEDFQVIKEVVLGILQDLLPCGVNRRKITWLTMKEAYVQKMVKVFNEHDRWSLISLCSDQSKTVGLRFVSSLRRQFEFSVDSFQIILDRMLESYWESDRKQVAETELKERLPNRDCCLPQKAAEESTISPSPGEAEGRDLTTERVEGDQRQDKGVLVSEKDLMEPLVEPVSGPPDVQQTVEPKSAGSHEPQNQVEEVQNIGDDQSEDDFQLDLCREKVEEKPNQRESSLVPSASLTDVRDPSVKQVSREPPKTEELYKSESLIQATIMHTGDPPSSDLDVIQIKHEESNESKAGLTIQRTHNESLLQEQSLECSFPPPAKKTCSGSQGVVPEFCPSPILQRKMSRKNITKSPPPAPAETWSLLTNLTTQLFQPIEIPKPLQPKADSVTDRSSMTPSLQDPQGSGQCVEQRTITEPVHLAGLLDSEDPQSYQSTAPPTGQTIPNVQLTDVAPSCGAGQRPCWEGRVGEPLIIVEAECMYGDFQQAMDHLRGRLIATHSPEEIRGGGLLKYSDLLVRNFRATSETEIKSLERYMCSRFFIDFPDVAVQRRKIEAHLRCHLVGAAGEARRYDYLMTLRRVIDESTVCLMGHERRQTLNMITVLALRVLGEQNDIPNTANVTCFYQPAPYMAEPIFSSYYFPPQPQPQLMYHPYPLHVQLPSGLV